MSEPTMIPHSRQAEEGLLGALLIDPERARRIVIEPEDFYLHRNGFVFSAITELLREGQPVDYITVCARLDSQKRLGEIGGPAFVTSLINSTPSSMNADGYAAIIRDRAQRRRIISAANKLATCSFDLDSDLSSGISDAMDTLARSVISDKGAVHISQFVGDIYDEVDAAQKNPREIFGIPTGFIDWDGITFGIQKGEKVLLTGEPGVGKSVLAAQVMINAAKEGYPGALYELEMSGRQVVRRALAAQTKDPKAPGHSLTNITTQKMRQGKLSDDEIPYFTAAVEQMSQLPIYISDASELTTVEMRADILRLKEYFGIQLVMIDYEGLLSDALERDDISRSKLISKRLHDIAKDLDVAVLAIGDMTKEGIKGTVKGQGAAAGPARALHDADQIIIVRKSEDNTSVRLTWEKQREGEADRFVDLVRVKGFPMFANAARRS